MVELSVEEFAKACNKLNFAEWLNYQIKKIDPTGWMLLLNVTATSPRFRSLTVLPYGPHSTFKAVPSGMFSPNGMAADNSIVVAILKSESV